jgi:hypothetical protein
MEISDHVQAPNLPPPSPHFALAKSAPITHWIEDCFGVWIPPCFMTLTLEDQLPDYRSLTVCFRKNNFWQKRRKS